MNENPTFLNYLLKNFSPRANYSEWLAIEDSVERAAAYYEDLSNDSAFVSLITGLIGHKESVDSITVDELLNITVIFFSIPRLTEEGYYLANVCVG